MLQPLAGVKLIPGYRLDKIEGEFRDPSKYVQYAIHDYGIIRQPKFSAVYAPFSNVSLHANWGSCPALPRPTRFFFL